MEARSIFTKITLQNRRCLVPSVLHCVYSFLMDHPILLHMFGNVHRWSQHDNDSYFWNRCCVIPSVWHENSPFLISSGKDRFRTIRSPFTSLERFIAGVSTTIIATYDVVDYRRIATMESTIITIYWLHIMWSRVFTSQL